MSAAAVFTSEQTIIGISEHVAMRAIDLVESRRVRLIFPRLEENQLYPGALVIGDEDDYHVWFTQEGCICTCHAGSEHAPGLPKCCHSVAAMMAWKDAER